MPGAVVSSVRVLAFHDVKLCLDAVNNVLQCFPHLQKLYTEVSLRTRVYICIRLSLVERQYCSKVRLTLDAISTFTLPFSDKKSFGERLVYIPGT